MDDVGKRTYYTGMSAVSGGSSASGSSASESASASDSARYFHYNHRGDTVLVTDANGEILHNLNYEAYGKPTNNEGIPINPLSLSNITAPNSSSNITGGSGANNLPNLFVGASGIRYDTKTNLHYMRFRWFSGEQMRFISADLLMDLNRYAYVSGNPVNYVDIFGLWKVYFAGGRIYAVPTRKGDNVKALIKAGYLGGSLRQKQTKAGKIFYDITYDIPPLIVKALAEQEKRNNASTGSSIDKTYVCAELVFATYYLLGYSPSNNSERLIDSSYNLILGRHHPEINMEIFVAAPEAQGFEEVSEQQVRNGTIFFSIYHEHPTHAGYHTGLDDIIISKIGVSSVEIGHAKKKHYQLPHTRDWFRRADRDLHDVPQNPASKEEKEWEIERAASEYYEDNKELFQYHSGKYYNKCKNP